MAVNRKNYTAKEKLKILQDLESSNLGAMEFCRRIGISYTTIHGWRDRVRSGKSLESVSKTGPVDPTKRIHAVEAYLKSGLTQDEFARTYGIGKSTISRWVRLHSEKGPKALSGSSLKENPKKRGSKGVPKAVRDEIIEVKRQNPQFGLRQVKGFLNRFRGVDAAVGTINKTIKEEKLQVKPPRRRRRRSSDKPRRFERAKAMQLWQTDITYFSLTKHQQRCYLTVFLDDHSRYIVGWRLGLRQTGEFVMEALLDGIQRFGRPREVLSDQGRQYFAWRGKTEFQNLLRKQGIQHVVARSHHPQTVGKCERLWKTIKDEFWDRTGPLDLQEAQERLSHFINHYNHFRPNQGIDNLVPADRFFGAEEKVRAALEKARGLIKVMAKGLDVTPQTLHNWKRMARYEERPRIGRPRAGAERRNETEALVREEMRRQGNPGWRPISKALPWLAVRLVQEFVAKVKAERRKQVAQERKAARTSIALRYNSGHDDTDFFIFSLGECQYFCLCPLRLRS